MKYNHPNISKCIVALSLVLMFSCKHNEKETPLIQAPKNAAYTSDTLQLSKEAYYDRVLGALVGSAIGDAMGASTEMWHRKDIQLKYGYITGLTPAERVQSPEGTWENNLLQGATTDDTRWKFLMTEYVTQSEGKPNARSFSKFINGYYGQLTKNLSDAGLATQTDLLDQKMEQIDWIKEWARVSLAYQNGMDAYTRALNRFYGGEMSCAGQLYAPMFGLIANNTEDAYALGYEHSLFDIGYAKDITASVSAMTHMALRTHDMDSILNVVPFTDLEGYQDSRLVGRIPYNIWVASTNQVRGIKKITAERDSLTEYIIGNVVPPQNYPGSAIDWEQQEMSYAFLEKEQKAIPFHSGEIWQILITGLAFGEGDFLKTIQYIVNYGRDNDTVAAVAGMVLGAKTGYQNLPKEIKEEVVKVNRDYLGIDLVAMARKITQLKYP
ncbi:ADP-ribosylglycohydrolase family protein [Maribacter aurantiacus]|uniref:ADP-ribosylglycohydrolase family protein n=1 Tax=Maribacter aurantiacus TaxID=1882343 RepID=A0A5R8MBN9_9FLAO|nr:ADP-ribosylglycohydrolase family protein [Maribacter aurantiacus]TLF46920.1 ADP-ribosylglycohydrolase family protein [Maribacter aurantiacus]